LVERNTTCRVRLGFLLDNTVTSQDDAPSDVYDAAVEIQVGPPQGEELAAASTCDGRQHHECGEPRILLCCYVDQSRNLIR
jgi:hypothetical protein